MHDAGTKSAASVSESHDLDEQIRHRAYELYEQRGRELGHELEDWLRAEKEVKRKTPIRAAA